MNTSVVLDRIRSGHQSKNESLNCAYDEMNLDGRAEGGFAMRLPMSSCVFRTVLLVALLVPAGVADATDGIAARIDELITSYEELGMFNGTALVATNGDISSSARSSRR